MIRGGKAGNPPRLGPLHLSPSKTGRAYLGIWAQK